MYFARSRLLVLFLLIWLGGLVDVASAQHRYIFPQFAFGGGWESTLMVLADATTNCMFSAQGRPLTMRDDRGNLRTGTELTLQGAFNLLKTETPSLVASSGMAVLDCNKAGVTANTLFSLEVGGSLVSEALVESAEEVVAGPDSFAWFPADHRGGARFGVAVANPSNQPMDVAVFVPGTAFDALVGTAVNVPANSAKAFFIDELGTIPPNRVVRVFISPSNNPGPSVYVIGLRFTGSVFTTIPAIVFPRSVYEKNVVVVSFEATRIGRGTLFGSHEYAYKLTLRNPTQTDQDYEVDLLFRNADGFVVNRTSITGSCNSYDFNCFRESLRVPAGQTRTFEDTASSVNFSPDPSEVTVDVEILEQ